MEMVFDVLLHLYTWLLLLVELLVDFFERCEYFLLKPGCVEE